MNKEQIEIIKLQRRLDSAENLSSSFREQRNTALESINRLEKENNSLKKKVKKLEKEIRELNTHTKGLYATIRKLNRDLDECEKWI